MHGKKRQSNKTLDSVKKRKAKRYSESQYRINRQARESGKNERES